MSHFKTSMLGWAASSTFLIHLNYIDTLLTWLDCAWSGNSTVSFISLDVSKLFALTKKDAIVLFSWRTYGSRGWSIWSVSLPLSMLMFWYPLFSTCLPYIVSLSPGVVSQGLDPGGDFGPYPLPPPLPGWYYPLLIVFCCPAWCYGCCTFPVLSGIWSPIVDLCISWYVYIYSSFYGVQLISALSLYILYTREKCTILRHNMEIDMEVYVDAEFTDNYDSQDTWSRDTVRSRYTYIVTYKRWPVSWKSQLQIFIYLFSKEPGYTVLSRALREIIPLIHVV